MNKTAIFSLLLLLLVVVSQEHAEAAAKYSLKICQPNILLEIKNKIVEDDPFLGEIDDTKTTLFISNTTYHKDRRTAHQLYYIEYHTKAATTIPIFFETDIRSDGSCQRTNSHIYILTE